MIYFAYGSNMHLPRLRSRAPSARALGIASLGGFYFCCNKRSVDGSSKGNILQEVGNRVWGVLFEISPGDESALDDAEGLGSGYERETVTVESASGPIDAVAYIASADAVDDALRPYSWYKANIVAGATAFGLPIDYLQMLSALEAVEDSNLERDQANSPQ